MNTGKRFTCDSPEVLSGFDPHSWLQEKIYLMMFGIYMVSALVMIFYFVFSILKKKEFRKRVYLLILYVSICILFVVKALFYLGGEDIIKYPGDIYRLLSFLPPFMEGGCFLVYCLGLQEILIREQEAEEGDDMEKYKCIKCGTFIFLVIYAICYISAHILNVILINQGDSVLNSLGKDIYFIYRFVAAILIAILVMWSTNKVRLSIAKFRDLYKQAIVRSILMAGCLILHCSLKVLTSILFISDVLIKVKCQGYNNEDNWYYVGYLSVYHFFNEYLPCMVILVLMTFQVDEHENVNQSIDSSSDVDANLQLLAKKTADTKKLKRSMAKHEDYSSDD